MNFWRRLKHLFIPHAGNRFRPGLLGASVLLSVLALALIVEGAYMAGRTLVLRDTGFLASVLPGVLVTLANDDREQAGLEDVVPNDLLTQAAQAKADDMAAKGYFAHVTPDGKEPWYFISQAGYKYEYAGENLAVNFEDSSDVEQAWMNSPAHRDNILKANYTNIGIAVAKGTYKGKQATFVVQYFASPAAVASAPAPVEPSAPQAKPIAAGGGEVAGQESGVAPADGAPVAKQTPPPATSVPAAPQAEQSSLTHIFLEAITSPAHSAAYALAFVAVLAGIIFLIALTAHVRVPYLRALGGSFALMVIVLGFMLYNSVTVPRLEVPADTAAAAILAL